MTYQEYLTALFAGKKDGIVSVIQKDRRRGTLDENLFLVLDKEFSTIDMVPYYKIQGGGDLNTNMIAYQIVYDLYRLYKKGVSLNSAVPCAFDISGFSLSQILLRAPLKEFKCPDHESKVYLVSMACGVALSILQAAKKTAVLKTILNFTVNDQDEDQLLATYRRVQELLQRQLTLTNGCRNQEVSFGLFFLPKRSAYIKKRRPTT
jgi:hypothetical protein